MDAQHNPAVERRERLARENPPPAPTPQPLPMARMHNRPKPSELADLHDIAEYAREHPAKDDK